MRINTVKKAQKDQGICRRGDCKTIIKVGDSYRWVKSRYGPKLVFCMKHVPRPSEMTSSDKLATIYGAQEDIADALAAFMDSDREGLLESFDSLISSIEEAVGNVEETAQEYESISDNMEEYFPGSPRVDEIREKAELAQSFADALDSAKGDIEDKRGEIEEANDIEEPDDVEELGDIEGDSDIEEDANPYQEKETWEEIIDRIRDEIENTVNDALDEMTL